MIPRGLAHFFSRANALATNNDMNLIVSRPFFIFYQKIPLSKMFCHRDEHQPSVRGNHGCHYALKDCPTHHVLASWMFGHATPGPVTRSAVIHKHYRGNPVMRLLFFGSFRRPIALKCTDAPVIWHPRRPYWILGEGEWRRSGVMAQARCLRCRPVNCATELNFI